MNSGHLRVGRAARSFVARDDVVRRAARPSPIHAALKKRGPFCVPVAASGLAGTCDVTPGVSGVVGCCAPSAAATGMAPSTFSAVAARPPSPRSSTPRRTPVPRPPSLVPHKAPAFRCCAM